MSFRFQKLVIGGTFDLLHLGHKKLLHTSFTEAKFVSIGLTTDSFNISRSKNTFQKYPDRRKKLILFLEKSGFSNRFKIIPIKDIYGNSHTDPDLEAIVVTPETVANSKVINEKRLQKKLPLLKTLIIDHVKDAEGVIVSSTRIRNGEIDSEGRPFLNFLLSISNVVLKEEVKNKLKKPLGQLIQHLPIKTLFPVITVGDITTRSFLQIKKTPDLAIVDLRTKRDQLFSSIAELGFDKKNADEVVSNPAGFITSDLINSLHKIINQKKHYILQINGEEDLAVLPAVLLSPLGTKVYYGQPSQGVVEITVNLESKEKIWTILNLLRK